MSLNIKRPISLRTCTGALLIQGWHDKRGVAPLRPKLHSKDTRSSSGKSCVAAAWHAEPTSH